MWRISERKDWRITVGVSSKCASLSACIGRDPAGGSVGVEELAFFVLMETRDADRGVGLSVRLQTAASAKLKLNEVHKLVKDRIRKYVPVLAGKDVDLARLGTLRQADTTLRI